MRQAAAGAKGGLCRSACACRAPPVLQRCCHTMALAALPRQQVHPSCQRQASPVLLATHAAQQGDAWHPQLRLQRHGPPLSLGLGLPHPAQSSTHPSTKTAGLALALASASSGAALTARGGVAMNACCPAAAVDAAGRKNLQPAAEAVLCCKRPGAAGNATQAWALQMPVSQAQMAPAPDIAHAQQHLHQLGAPQHSWLQWQHPCSLPQCNGRLHQAELRSTRLQHHARPRTPAGFAVTLQAPPARPMQAGAAAALAPIHALMSSGPRLRCGRTRWRGSC